MDRSGSFWPALTFTCLLACLAAGAVWLAERGVAPKVRALGQPSTAKSGTPTGGVAQPRKAADSTMGRPRLFLARDRVRRLPAVHEPAERQASASIAGEPNADVAAGPILFGLEDEHREAKSPPSRPATTPRRGVLEPPELPLAAAMPECPPLNIPVPAAASQASETPARSVPPVPTAGPREPFLAEANPVPPTPEPPEQDTLTRKPALAESATDPGHGRSEQMEQIAREADRHTRRGFELAGRGAVFAARAQFVRALRLLAQGLDTEQATQTHSQALADGLDAIQEADSFLPRGARMEADLDLAVIVRGHRTPVLKSAEMASLTPMTALKAYFTFAQERLAAAADKEVAGSMALHGLGKLHAAMARNPASDVAAAEPKAVAFFQAALLVYPRNLMAANDLGVLLARAGNGQGAQRLLEHAVAVNPQSVSWHNLEKVYQQLGEMDKARYARQMATAARQEMARRGKLHESDKVRWLAPGEFAETHVHSRATPVPHTGQTSPAVPRFNRR